MKWIEWKNQGELAQLIAYCIDKDSYRELLVKDVLRESKNKYTEKEIIKELERLIKLWLVIENDGEIRVTECSHDGICKAMNEGDFAVCLKKLKRLNVFHPDMLLYRVIEKSEERK